MIIWSQCIVNLKKLTKIKSSEFHLLTEILCLMYKKDLDTKFIKIDYNYYEYSVKNKRIKRHLPVCEHRFTHVFIHACVQIVVLNYVIYFFIFNYTLYKNLYKLIITKDRLNALKILNIESKITKQIKYGDIIDDLDTIQFRKKL